MNMKGISMVLIVLMIVAMMPVGTATPHDNYGPTQPSNVTLYTYFQDGDRVVSTEIPLNHDGGVIVTPANFETSNNFNGSIRQHRIDMWRASFAQ